MVKVDRGTHWYEITGDKEKEAAKELTDIFDFYEQAIGHRHIDANFAIQDTIERMTKISEKYGVTISSS